MDTKFGKIVFCGKSGVGKSTLVGRLMNEYVTNQAPTIGASYHNRKVLKDDVCYDISVWDTSGQDRYQNISYVYFRSSNCCVLVFDLGSMASLQELPKWKAICDAANNGHVDYILVGNKSDREIIEVSKSDAKEMCHNIGINNYFELSSLSRTREKIDDLWDCILSSVNRERVLDEGVVDITDDDEEEIVTTSDCDC